MPDTVTIDYYHEAALAFKLGYSLFCQVAGIPGDLVVRDARMIGDDNHNFEVRVLEGWRKPVKCWAIGPSEGVVKDEQVVEQKGLFG